MADCIDTGFPQFPCPLGKCDTSLERIAVVTFSRGDHGAGQKRQKLGREGEKGVEREEKAIAIEVE